MSPILALQSLDNLWFQVSGTVCNIACHHCFISCSPTNHSFEIMTLEQIRPILEESQTLGVKEYYFTGGEPFLNKEILPILSETLKYGPVTVLSNGMLFKDHTLKQLEAIEMGSSYTMEIRISLDGFTEEANDAIRGKGVFRKTMEGIGQLVRFGFLPIITTMKSWDDADDENILKNFNLLMQEIGYMRPRLKLIPSLKLGQEIMRSRGYEKEERVSEEMMTGFDASQLLCSNSRIMTSGGAYVCPILIDSPSAKLGETLQDAVKPYPLNQAACYTCYISGAICSNATTTIREN